MLQLDLSEVRGAVSYQVAFPSFLGSVHISMHPVLRHTKRESRLHSCAIHEINRVVSIKVVSDLATIPVYYGDTATAAHATCSGRTAFVFFVLFVCLHEDSLCLFLIELIGEKVGLGQSPRFAHLVRYRPVLRLKLQYTEVKSWNATITASSRFILA